MDKRLLRKHYIYLRSAQPTQLKTDASLKICKKVMKKMRNMTKMIMDDKNHLYLSEKSRMIDS